jgi:hypothetical protein
MIANGSIGGEVIMLAMSVALVTAKATEKRAAGLLETAKASPEALGRARGIYLRAKARADRLNRALGELMITFSEGGAS